MQKRRVPINNINTINLASEDEESDKQKKTLKQRLCRWFTIITIILITLVILGFIVVFVVFPLIFMNSTELQRWIIFHNRNETPGNPNFANPKEYGIQGARNIFVTVNENPSVSLGVWHILPESLINEALNNENFDYKQALSDGRYPAVLYFHDTDGNRITPVNTYTVLRKFFHVIAFDYRSYGDSSEADLLESKIVSDSINLYKWLSKHTEKIFLWGHSLGGALSTHTALKLYELNLKPIGLFLEAPFTTWAEQFDYSTIADVYSWLVWYYVTILKPMYTNGFRFETSEYVLSVDCPIMIVHAEDDAFTPFSLGQQLAEIAKENRRDTQGNITFYSFTADLNYDHWRIHEAPELLGYIKKHIDICYEYSNGID